MVSKKVSLHNGNRRKFCDGGCGHLRNDINEQRPQTGGVLVSTYGLTATSAILGRSYKTSVPAQRISGLAKGGCSEV